MKIYKNSLVSLLIIAVTVGGILIPEKAQSQSYDDLVKECGVDTAAGVLAELGSSALNAAKSAIGLSPKVPVLDTDNVTQHWVDRALACAKALLSVSWRMALAHLRKQILDRIVDDIVHWIETGDWRGKPLFDGYFPDIGKDALDAAIGQTLQDLGLGALCEPMPALIKFNYFIPRRPPTFTQRVSCTLSDIVENIEAFKNDFTEGGWIAFNESLAPQNNFIGLEILLMDQVAIEASARRREREVEIISGGGYLGLRECAEWSRKVAPFVGGELDISVMHLEVLRMGDNEGSLIQSSRGDIRNDRVQWSNNYLTEKPPSDNEPDGYGIKEEWKCSREQVSLPSGTVQTMADAAVTADFDFLINTDDLHRYASAIFDALGRRIIREGVGWMQRGTEVLGSKTQKREDPDPLDLDDEDMAWREQAMEQYSAESIIEGHKDEAREMVALARRKITNVYSSIEEEERLRDELIEILDELINCQYRALYEEDTHDGKCPLQIDLRNSIRDIEDLENLRSSLEKLAEVLNDLEAEIENATSIQVAITLNSSVGSLIAEIESVEKELEETRIARMQSIILRESIYRRDCQLFVGDIDPEHGQERPQEYSCPN